jgi:phosphoesterase, MJ0936 family
MKIAVLADIHGNLPALAAVAADIAAWNPDAVVVGGDIVNRGPSSAACLRFVQERCADSGWRLIRGNHEDYVISVVHDPTDRPGIEGAIRRNVRWTADQLGAAAAELERLPEIISLHDPAGGEVRIVHASMRHNRDNVLATTPDDELREQIAPPCPLIVVGHTHRPLIRRIDSTLVVNVGSVGLPFDGDTRACYGRMEWRDGIWHAEIVRLPYDRERAEYDFIATGYLDTSGPVARLVYDEFRTGWPRIYTWVSRYREAVLAGELSVDESIDELLALCNGGPPPDWKQPAAPFS